ncbi:energy-coupling factor transporter transmembrane protein EcfT [Bacillaceae bacterium SIJ1]|uniref:energy-coupling factor transporter transmembrane component T family protein n=1 Tax=Litoribacterium kuwaitense TaxID=1398745 RepID=UPI0013EC7B39|nr:energy-coupling factor transporter transmembrane component T [Litoribacterium kuwaitense]NGP45871.1 energy-coupling factor transporter transmembrane protein EcfT [Litoribacterium kuwaitense]
MKSMYVAQDSVIHKTDPRAKIVMIIVVTILSFVLHSPSSYIFLGVLVLLTYIMTRLPWRTVWPSLKPVLWLAGFAFLLHVVSATGTDLWVQWGWVKINEESVLQAGRILLRLLIICAAGFLLPLTTSPSELVAAFAWMLKPLAWLGFSPADGALAMTITVRYTTLLAEEARRIFHAQKARGAELTWRHPRQTFRHLQAYMIPLAVGTIRRAHALAEAIDARGYDGSRPRSAYRDVRWTFSDSLKLSIFLLAAGGIYWIQ